MLVTVQRPDTIKLMLDNPLFLRQRQEVLKVIWRSNDRFVITFGLYLGQMGVINGMVTSRKLSFLIFCTDSKLFGTEVNQS